MLELEVGLKLNNNKLYYNKILKNHNAVNVYIFETHDLYWTNKDLNGMTENEMKKSCIRLRMTRMIGGKNQKLIRKIKNKFGIKGKWHCKFQNFNLFDNNEKDTFEVSNDKINSIIDKIENKNYIKVFDTFKIDYQYTIGNMKSKIQLQDIKDIGLLLYYDNPDLYKYPLIEQRNKLIDELNSYGFNFKYDENGLDKLRTLYYKKEMFSLNQNG